MSDSKEIDLVSRIRGLRYVHVPQASQLFEEAAAAIEGLLAINESLRREIRTQRTEIAALREEQRAAINADRPWRNETPEAGWVP